MRKKTIIILSALVLLVTLAILGMLGLLNSRVHTTEPVRLYLPNDKYTSYNDLCDECDFNNAFRLMVKVSGMQGKRVRPGSYVIEPGMKNFALLRKLRNGQQDPLRLTIGKFRTPQQLNDFLNQKLMHDDFSITLDSFFLVRPETYEFYWTVSPEAFLQRMRKQFERENLDKETVILASIVEEETNHNPEKPLIASIYLNRLKRGMPLQADPTVKYAVGDFSLRRILNKHLAVESPFNTYLHTGLPPAPICLPSKTSVDAVRNAPETNYLYFCASEKMDGTHRFASTLAEHQRNAARFHQALNQRGIK